jgi:riboflavin biosynthesis pyrimidine reductase
MSVLAALESLYEVDWGDDLPLPPELAALYGRLRFPAQRGRPYVIGNFVTTLDGVVSLDAPGQSGGRAISGSNPHDHLVMGLLRAMSDAVIVGAGTLRASPNHLWTSDYIYPTFAEAYQSLRIALGKPEPPLNVIVTASGTINLRLPVFQSGKVPVLIVTNTTGAECIRNRGLPQSVQIVDLPVIGPLSARAILKAVRCVRRSDFILTEGGPRLMGKFFAEKCLDELFLTLAPQIAGRDAARERPGLVAGQSFAPEHPLWGTLIGVKRASHHLFLRYAFETTE